jgi:nitrite reductase/ring-hydroxylating ferredoxin subunit
MISHFITTLYLFHILSGSYCNGHVRCPWHGALFDVRSGDIEDFPGLDSLPKFAVGFAFIFCKLMFIYLDTN